ncbi:MAG: 50S ribosomal protein L18 [Flavobacteriales bacterium]|nr:50S ribosomal protein L18 [Flavobacteriales bacterium]
MTALKVEKRLKIKRRVRKNIFGTASKPRLSVFRSNKEIYGQIIDDVEQKTLLAVSSRTTDVSGNKVEQAYAIGKKLGEQAVSNGIEVVIFDRNGYLYHGRVKNFADGAREGGLKF